MGKWTMQSAAHFLDAGLKLEPLPKTAREAPAGTCCAMTGLLLKTGYLVSDVTTTATNEFLDTFHGQTGGWLCEAAARAFKVQNLGNVAIMEDGTCERPMISRESAAEQKRACWSDFLRVLAHLAPSTQIVNYDQINFDNLLCAAVVEEAWNTVGAWGWQARPAALPCPLTTLWRDERGLSLYAAGLMQPLGASTRDVVYHHKRAPRGAYSRGNSKDGGLRMETNKGRYMERQIPMPTLAVQTLECFCVGDPAEIARLLENISHLGKRRGNGFGAVERWEIQPARHFASDCVCDTGGIWKKALPMAAASALGIAPEGALSLVGWTPAQWNPATFLAGWRAGTPCA